MRKTINREICLLLMLVFVTVLSITVSARASYEQKNEETGYLLVVDDEADLLSREEETLLIERMDPITTYGGVCFLTLDQNSSSARRAAEDTYYQYFKNNSGVLLLIDMDNREIWMSTNGEIFDIVDSDYCSTITDNIYRYATEGDYYTCADKAFEQVGQLLAGEKIAQPMRYITNALLAVVLAILLNFGLINRFSSKRRHSSYRTLEGAVGGVEILNLSVEKGPVKKKYSPSSSGGGGGSSSGSSGGGGGGFSGGGGGGHSF